MYNIMMIKNIFNYKNKLNNYQKFMMDNKILI